MESIISGIVIFILISALNQWKEFTEFTYITVFFAVLAASINLAGSVFYIYTIKHVKVGMGFVIINSLFPLFSIIGSIFFLGDKLSLPIYLGAVFILIGISIIAIKRDSSFSFLEQGSSMKIAIIFCTLTPLSWAIGALIMDRLLDYHAVLPLVFIRAINTFIICIGLSILIKKVSFKQAFRKIQTIPGFKVEIILKRIPKILLKKESLKMGLKIAKGVSEKSIIRMIKITAKEA